MKAARWRRFAAYGGRGWHPRTESLGNEIAAGGGVWAPMRVDSEYRRLRTALLYRPGPEFASLSDPNAAQHLGRLDLPRLRREIGSLAAVYGRLGVDVEWMEPDPFAGSRAPDRWNLMYVRDLFFGTREGVVISRMASRVRAGEEKFAARALSRLAVPINRGIAGRGLLEGADALWLDSKTVLCGVGRRTNAEGLRQLREALIPQGARVLSVKLPRGAQHLLGILQVVDRRLALLRSAIAPASLPRLLLARGFRLVDVPESAETIEKGGMNVVAVAPRRLVMPSGCPGLGRLYRRAGLHVAAEVPAAELLKGGGGLACATGILWREG